MKKKLYILCIVFLTSTLIAQDNEELKNKDAVDETEFITFSGFFGGTAGLGVGMVEPSKGFDDKNVDFIIGAVATSALNLTIQPNKDARIVGSIEANIDDESIASPWKVIQLSELYLEYNMLDSAFYSFGIMDITVANDFIDIDSETTFLIKQPHTSNNLHIFVQADNDTIVNGEFDYRKLYVGTWIDIEAGPALFTTGFTYKKRDDMQFQDRFGTLFSTKISFFGVGAYSDVHYFAYPEHFMYGDLGIFYTSEKLFFGAEYNVEGYITKYDYLKQGLDVNFRWLSIFDKKIDVYLASKLRFDNLSGFVIPAIAVRPLNYVSISLSLPYIFGVEGFTLYNDMFDGDYTIKLDTELSALLSISVYIPF